MSRLLKGIFWFILLLLGLFVLINWQFFVKQIDFWVRHDVLNQTLVSRDIQLSTPDQLRIPSLGIVAPLVYVDETDEITFQIGLTQGVVHYPGTALLGEYGNAFFFGHSSDFPTKPGNYKTVFALLPNIEVGEEIIVTDRAGRLLKYIVFDKQVVSPLQTEFLDQGGRQERLLTLQTSYPVGTALRRYIVRARML